MKKLLMFLFLTSLFGGCTSRLKVKVSVLQSSYLTNDKEVLEARVNIFRRKYFGSNKFNDLKSQILLELNDILGQLKTNSNIDSTTKSRIQMQADESISDKIKSAQMEYDSAIIKLAKPIVDVVQLKDALLKFETGDIKLNEVIGEVDKIILKLKESVAGASNLQVVNLQRTQNDVQKAVNAIVLAPLFDDPMTSIVVNGGKDKWKGKTNEAKARSFMGNSDIAIVMESPGEYSLKGIRNDASQATKALFTITNLTVQTLAKAYGVGLTPVPTTDSSTYFAQIQVARNDLEKAEKFSQKAFIDIFQAILNEEANITADTIRIRRSINKIDILVKNKQTQLNK
ncbi:MAG: hypothetical protein EAZ70_07645 [Runella slithyformis]|nr:MAG: hypothetical protein EAY79_06990 [Runella slithyformis]TAF27207.1 MAG: hypothetical protein EAZ70_07645 [Runella slithyformis]TAF45855.1 MAG: hypothetical protein EAZ63_10450 [Runella slithyformis]TAF80682.1 MAG: hypothetical protein EAZ50_08265 [Runella slithyformis]